MSSQVTRPALPLVVWVVTGVFTGILIAEEMSWRYATSATALSLEALGLAALLSGSLTSLACWRACNVRSRHGRTPGSPATPSAVLIGLIVVSLCLGVSAGSVRWSGWHAVRTALVSAEESTSDTLAVVIRDPVRGRFGWSAIARPMRGSPVRVRVMLPAEEPPPRLGEVIELPGRIDPVDLGQEWSRRSHQRVEAGSIRVRSAAPLGWARTPGGAAGPLRALVNERVSGVGGVGGDLLQGVLLGDRTRLRGTLTEDEFRICGLSHLMAVSGTHLGIVALVITRALTRARRGLRARVVFALAAMVGYVVLTGIQPSSLRALGMGGVAGLATLSGRRGDGLAALSVAAGGMMLADPAVAFDIGFRLSVSAVTGLILFGPLVSAWVRAALGSRKGRCLRTAGDMLALTLVAQAATAPVAIPAFGMFSLIAPLANVVALPLLTIALGAGLCAAAAGLLVPAAAEPLLALAALPLRLIAAVASRLAAVPGAALGLDAPPLLLGVSALLGGIVVWGAWPLPGDGVRRARVAGALLCVSMLFAAVGPSGFGGAPLLTVLDVGQGDAVLVRDAGKTLLIDTGPDPGTLRSALTRAGVRRIDALLLTHDHADHTGGVGGIVGVARIDRAYGPALADPDAFGHVKATLGRLGVRSGDGEVIQPLVAGDVLTVGRSRLEVLWPRAPDSTLSTNDTSVVLHLTRDSFSAMLAGDAEGGVWNVLRRDGAIPDVEVVLVPHHGSRNGMTSDALEAWGPRLAMVSAGSGNDFGHPSPETLALLDDRAVPVARTDLHGDIMVMVGSDGGFRIRVQVRGVAVDGCATIPVSIVRHASGSGEYVDLRPHRSQARIPHPRERRALARAGRGPPEETARCRRGPGLQPRPVRR